MTSYRSEEPPNGLKKKRSAGRRETTWEWFHCHALLRVSLGSLLWHRGDRCPISPPFPSSRRSVFHPATMKEIDLTRDGKRTAEGSCRLNRSNRGPDSA